MFHIPKWHVGLDLKFAFLNVNEIHYSHLPILKLDYFPFTFIPVPHTPPQRLGGRYGSRCKEHGGQQRPRVEPEAFLEVL